MPQRVGEHDLRPIQIDWHISDALPHVRRSDQLRLVCRTISDDDIQPT